MVGVGTERKSAESETKETRERILDSAERIFSEKGYGGARIKEIAEGAGITGAMVHYYFRTKDELHRAVMDRMFLDLVDLVEHIAPAPLEPVDKLRRFFFAIFDYFAKHRSFARLTAMQAGHENQDYFFKLVKIHVLPMYLDAVEFFEKGMEMGLFRNVDPHQLLAAIYGMIISYFADSPFLAVLMGTDGTGRDMVDSRRRILMEMILRVLLKQPEFAEPLAARIVEEETE